VLYSAVTVAKVTVNSGVIWQLLGTCRGNWSFVGAQYAIINNR